MSRQEEEEDNEVCYNSKNMLKFWMWSESMEWTQFIHDWAAKITFKFSTNTQTEQNCHVHANRSSGVQA